MSAGEPQSPAARRCRLVDKDETWGGAHELEDLRVDAGATLVLAAGTRLRLKAGARVAVRGRLVARGRAGSPVLLEGEGWLGLYLRDGGRAELTHAHVSGAADAGLKTIGDGAAALRDCVFASCATGLELSGGRVSARRCAWSACTTAVKGEAGAVLRGADLRFSRGGAGVSWTGALLALRGVETSLLAGPLLALAGKAHAVRGLRGAGAGVLHEAGTLRARGWTLAGAPTALTVGGAPGGAEAGVSQCRFDSCGTGLLLLDAGADLDGCALSDCSEAGVRARGALSRLRVWRTRLERCATGLDAQGGVSELGAGVSIANCGLGVRVGAHAVLRGSGEPPSARPAGLRGAVLRARDFPPARAAFRAAYALGEAALRVAAARGAQAAWTHRGRLSPDWAPGLSDLDAVWLSGDLEGPGGWERARAFWRRYGAARAALPFLGEMLLASPEDAAFFASSGAARSWELAAARPLRGAPPAPPPGAPDRDACLAEAFVSYTLACSCLFDRAEPWPVVRHHALKAVVDALRWLGAARTGRLPPPRAQARSGLDPAWRARLAALEAVGEDGLGRHEALGRGAAALLAALDAACDGEPERPLAPPCGGLDAAAARLQRLLDGRLVGLVDDGRHRRVAVVESADEGLGEGLASWALHRRFAPAPEPLPLPLTRAAWRAWSRLPYLDDPSPGSGAREGAGPSSWGRLESAPPLSRESARRAAASFLMGWRWTLGPGRVPGEATGHWALTRALGLRLALETGEAPPFCALEQLAAAHARLDPAAAARLAALRRDPDALMDPDRGLGAFVTEQLAPLRAALRSRAG